MTDDEGCGDLMKSIKFKGSHDPEKKIVVSLFWTVRKTIREEGCAPVRITSIRTSKRTYEPEGRKLLKLSDEIMEDIIGDIERGNTVEFSMTMGQESLRLWIDNEAFTVETSRTPELEEEIVEKLEHETSKLTPDFCQTFLPKIFPNR